MSVTEWAAPLAVLVGAIGFAAVVNGPRRIRLSLSFSFVALLIGAVLFMYFMASRSTLPIIFLVGFGLVTLLGGLARAAPLVRMRRMILRLSNPQLADGARNYIQDWAATFRPDRHEARLIPVYANVICTASGALLGRDYVADSEQVLANLPEDLGEPKLEALRGTLLTMTRVSLGQHEQARAAIERAPKAVDHESTDQMLMLARALVDCVQGKADEAEAAVENDLDAEQFAQLAGFTLVIMAHVYAQRDDPDKAREMLVELERAGGQASLARVVGQKGPASPLAADMLTSAMLDELPDDDELE